MYRTNENVAFIKTEYGYGRRFTEVRVNFTGEDACRGSRVFSDTKRFPFEPEPIKYRKNIGSRVCIHVLNSSGGFEVVIESLMESNNLEQI